MERPQRTRLGVGQDVLGMMKLGGREEEKDQTFPTSPRKRWRSRSSDHNRPAEGTSTTSEKSQPEDR